MEDDAQRSESPDSTDPLWNVGLRIGFGAFGGADSGGRARRSNEPDAGDGEPPHPSGRRRIDHFELIEEIGHGGMGAVYRARDLVLEREVAVKVLLDPPSRIEASKRFDRECRAIAKLRHAHIVPIYAVGEADGVRYFAMPLLKGGSLALKLAELRAKGTRGIPPREAARIAHGIASALVVTHDANVLHRDLKPSNVLFDGAGEPMLIDFGLARDQDRDDPTLSVGFIGTPRYAAPETLEGRGADDVRVDVFGLGAMLYEMLTLRPPRSGDSLSEVLASARADDLAPPRKVDRAIPRDLETICCHAMERDPARRYRTARDLEADLRRYLEHRPIAARPASLLLNVKRWVRRHPARASAWGISIAVVLGFLSWVFAPAGLRIETDPPGAEIFIDGASTGRFAPAGVSAWPARLHEVEVRLPGYQRQARVVESERGGGNVPLSFALAPARGTITATSPLRGVRLELLRNGRAQNLTPPLENAALDVGSYRVCASMPNHLDRWFDLVVQEGRVTALNVDLEPMLLRDLPLSGFKAVDLKTADLDRDGTPDVVSLSRSPQESGYYAEIQATHGADGRRLWSSLLGNLEGVSELLIHDFDRDAIPDVACATWPPEDRRGELFVLSGRTGATIWQGSAPTRVIELGVAGRDDLGEPLIIALCQDGLIEGWSVRRDLLAFQHRLQGSASDGTVCSGWIFDRDGASFVVAGWDYGRLDVVRCADRATATTSLPSAPTAVLQIPLDGADLLVGCEGGTVHVVHEGDARALAKHEQGEVLELLAVPDQNGDGVADVVVAGNGGGFDVLAMPSGNVLRRAAASDLTAYAAIAAELTGAAGDVAFAASTAEALSRKEGRVSCLSLAGAPPMIFTLQDHEAQRIACADFDGDGFDDVAVAFSSTVSKTLSLKLLSFRSRDSRWRFATEADVWSSAATGDLDGDRRPDVVIGSNGGDVFALSGLDGHRLWSVRTRGKVWSSPVLHHLDRDGILDVVVGSDDGHVYAMSGIDGSLLWPPFDTRGEVSCTPRMQDWDADGIPDIIVGSKAGFVHVLSGRTGTELWPRFSSPESDRDRGFYATPALLDVDGDGRWEILAPCLDGQVYVFSSRDGALLRQLDGGSKPMHSSPACADFDRDSKDDVVIATGDGRVQLYSSALELQWETKLRCKSIESSPAIHDLDGDGIPDIVVGSGSDFDGHDVTALSGADGSLLWAYRTGDVTWSSPVLIDVDGDGACEVISGSADAHFYVLDGCDGSLRMKLRTEGQLYGRAAVTDLDGDGVPEAIFGGYDDAVHAFSLPPSRLAARKLNLAASARVLQSLSASNYRAAIAEVRSMPSPSAEMRLATGMALLGQGATTEAQVELRAAAAAGLRSPDLSVRLLLCALATGEAADVAVIAEGIAGDPLGFLEQMIQLQERRKHVDAAAERKALESILLQIPATSGRALLARGAVAVFVGSQVELPELDQLEGDPVSVDLAHALDGIAKLLEGRPTHALRLIRTEAVAFLFARLPRDAEGLRAELRLDPR